MKGMMNGSVLGLGLWLLSLVPLLGGGGKSIAFAQDEIPEVGLGAVHPICNASSSASGDCVPSDEEVQEEIIAELEADDEVTDARQDIQLGELLCDSLDAAEDAELLRFEIFSNETVTAQRTSFTVVDADVFTDGDERKIWKGDVVDPAPADDTLPRTISMTWATPCDVETFLLKMIDTNPDGTTSVTTSVPCDAGSSTQICMVQFDINLPTPSEPVVPAEADELYDTAGASRYLLGDRSASWTPSRRRRRHPLDKDNVNGMPGRRLQETTQVDVMVLYSSDSLARVVGGVTAEQMETLIADELPKATEATTNSEVDLHFNLVHTGPLPYNQATTGSSEAFTELLTFTYDPDVAALRDTYAADLVVLVGSFSGTCGLGWVNTNTVLEDERYGFSLMDARCFEGKTTTHEMGHNLGCLHDTANNNISPVNDYSHGMRYCTGSGTRFHTIMAYYCGYNPPDEYFGAFVPALNHFSNPDVSYLGVPTGTATANNAQTIRDNMEAVSRFRVKCQGDSDCEGTGTCVNEICGVTECESAGGNIFLAGDGYCASENNIAECGFDGGDCCECDCEGFGDVCGSDGYDCLNEFSDCYVEAPNEICETTDVEGLVGTNDVGSVCCPTGCGQCGGAGCGRSGAGEGLGNMDCCINGVLNNHELCSTSGQAPCVIETTTITPEVENCGTTGIEGLVGTNDVGSVCCPTGCGQCGGAGCGSSGAGEGLGNTDCCINGVLNNHDTCSAIGQAPCVIDEEPATGADTCDSLGILAIEGTNDNGSVCCPEKCMQCGGAGCASSGAASGLDNTDCCINGVLANQGSCADSGEAPCVL